MAQEQHRTTARILDIFEQVSISEEGLTLTALAQRLSAPKSSLFPIVHTMEERRYLIQDYGTGRYQIGPGALILLCGQGGFSPGDPHDFPGGNSASG